MQTILNWPIDGRCFIQRFYLILSHAYMVRLAGSCMNRLSTVVCVAALVREQLPVVGISYSTISVSKCRGNAHSDDTNGTTAPAHLYIDTEKIGIWFQELSGRFQPSFLMVLGIFQQVPQPFFGLVFRFLFIFYSIFPFLFLYYFFVFVFFSL